MSFEWIVQEKIFESLNNIITTPVYDVAPQNAVLPYVTIGRTFAVNNDTDTTINQLVSFTINTWAETNETGSALKQIKQLQGEIFNALHWERFEESGYIFTENIAVSSQEFPDSDGVTLHGAQEFKLTIERK